MSGQRRADRARAARARRRCSDGSPRRDFARRARRRRRCRRGRRRPRPCARGAEELDPAGAVDEVEEDELAHVAARHDAAGEAPRPRAPSAPGSSGSASARTRGDLVAVGKALRQAHRRASLAAPRGRTIAQASAAAARHRLVEHDLEAVRARRRRGSLACSSAARTAAGARDAPSIARLEQRAADAAALCGGSTPMPAEDSAARATRAPLHVDGRGRRRGSGRRRRAAGAASRASARWAAPARSRPAARAGSRARRRGRSPRVVDARRRSSVEADVRKSQGSDRRAALRAGSDPAPRRVVAGTPARARRASSCASEPTTCRSTRERVDAPTRRLGRLDLEDLELQRAARRRDLDRRRPSCGR